MGLNHLQSLICTYSADNLRPLMLKSNITFPHNESVRVVIFCQEVFMSSDYKL